MNGREQGGAIQGEGKGGAVVEGEQRGGGGKRYCTITSHLLQGEGGDSLVFSLYKTTSRCLKAIDKL